MPSTVDTTQLVLTIAALVLGLALIATMAVLERKPRTSLNPRMIPTTPVILIGALVSILSLVHLFNLYGLHTGR
ncbi:MAG: hypothetical protein U1F47_07745 [Hyphomicrobiales bacterium]